MNKERLQYFSEHMSKYQSMIRLKNDDINTQIFSRFQIFAPVSYKTEYEWFDKFPLTDIFGEAENTDGFTSFEYRIEKESLRKVMIPSRNDNKSISLLKTHQV